MKIVFISDFFETDLIGGAELNDGVLIEYLIKSGFEVECVKSNTLTFDKAVLNNNYIISNFVGLKERVKQVIMLKKYIIYEHDHKYLKNRDPSIYPKFKAPETEIINKQFYEKAEKVIVLSKICKQVIEKNLNLTNVVSIGCSLWSDKKLDFIEALLEEKKTKDYCIIKSSNPIKGTKEAIQFCNAKNYSYDLIGPTSEKDLLAQMSKYEHFVFIPKVLETLSRVVVEAKMLECKVLTRKNLIGAASEDWFEMSGKNLINKMREKRKAALKIFEACFSDTGDITVILNCYRRPEYLKEQIQAIRSQTISPKEIWLWVNYHEDNDGIDFSKFNVDKVIRNDFNWKFYGRFTVAMMARTKYIAMFDDDTIPGERWFENCHNTIKINNGILVGNGISVTSDRYVGRVLVGWTTQNEKTIEVDLGGHAWFFETKWLRFLWLEKPFTIENGEDIQFSYCAQKYGNIKTFCPPHPNENPSLHSSLKGYEMGVDEVASSRTRKHSQFYAQRDACVKNAITNGWIPINRRKDEF